MSSSSVRTSAPVGAVARDQDGRMPAARAPSTSASGVSPTCQVSLGRAPTSSSAARKMAPSGLAEPTSAEASAPSTSSASPGLVQPLVQRPVPVGDDRGPDPGRAQRPQHARAVLVGVEAQRRQQRVQDDGRRERQVHRFGAADPQVQQRLAGRGPRAGAPGSRRSRPGSRPRRPARRCRRRSARAAPPAGAAPGARR